MSSSGPQVSRDAFLQQAVQLNLLSPDAADDIARESAARQQMTAQLALQRNLLTATQIDIVDTLLRPDSVVPGYLLLGVLGYGGMGVVYRARQKNLNRVVALKTVLLNQMGDPSAIHRFEHEAQNVARLAHPHIVAAYDYGQHEGRVYFVMELVEGEDVQRLIRRRGWLDEATTWGLIRQAAAGLAHAQQVGIVHRDIKPANLLLVEPPAGFPLPPGMPLVKIADFGLARLTTEAEEQSRLTADQSAVGSPHYMSPEQLQGDCVDHRADIYALGASAYHMLSGQPPLMGKSISQLITLKLAGKVPPLQNVREGVGQNTAELIRRMMSVDPAHRPRDYRELIALIDVCAHELTQDSITLDDDSFDRTQPMLQADSRATLARKVDATSELNPPRQSATTNVSDRRYGDTPRTAAEMAMAPTLELPLAASAKKRSLTRVLPMVMAGAAVVALLLSFIMYAFRAPPPVRSLVADGQPAPLFDGRSITGWQLQSGAWFPAHNADNAEVLSGMSGVARRPLPKLAGPHSQHYRLTIHAQLHQATAAEILVGLHSGATSPRLILRLTKAGAQVGSREGERGEFHAISPIWPYLLDPEAQHDVQIERQPGGWWFFVEEQHLGAVADDQTDELPEFRLAAEGGPAWFSDIVVEKLITP